MDFGFMAFPYLFTVDDTCQQIRRASAKRARRFRSMRRARRVEYATHEAQAIFVCHVLSRPMKTRPVKNSELQLGHGTVPTQL